MGHEESKATANVKVASGVCGTGGLQRGGEGAFRNWYSQQNFWLLQREDCPLLQCWLHWEVRQVGKGQLLRNQELETKVLSS